MTTVLIATLLLALATAPATAQSYTASYLSGVYVAPVIDLRAGTQSLTEYAFVPDDQVSSGGWVVITTNRQSATWTFPPTVEVLRYVVEGSAARVHIYDPTIQPPRDIFTGRLTLIQDGLARGVALVGGPGAGLRPVNAGTAMRESAVGP